MTDTAERLRRVALVTGGSRGIGAAVARALAARGYDLVLTYASREDAAAAVAADCEAEGSKAVPVRADLADPRGVTAAFEEVDRWFGRLDLLVNNAGTLPAPCLVEGFTAERVSRTLAVNTVGPTMCCAEAVSRMSTGRGGRGGVIVNVSSRAAVRGGAGEFVDYAMSKAALDVLTLALAQEVGHLGIRVVGVRPGLIDTDMNAAQPGRVERLLGSVPLGRVGRPEEVAEAVCWLASDAAGYVTGVTLDVSGGR